MKRLIDVFLSGIFRVVNIYLDTRCIIDTLYYIEFILNFLSFSFEFIVLLHLCPLFVLSRALLGAVNFWFGKAAFISDIPRTNRIFF